MQLAAQFVSNIQTLYGQAGTHWLNELPIRIEQLAAKWDFILLQAMDNLTYNFVALVRLCTSDKMAVLKMSPDSESLATQINWLNSFEQGVPIIYASDVKTNALLMEFLKPGIALKEFVKAGKDDEATRIICQTIRQLQQRKPTTYPFKHLSELASALSLLQGHFDAKLLSQAVTLFRELVSDRTYDVVLHGDLHHDNILSCGSEWKVIDPHGYLGDPAFDASVMIYNPLDFYPQNLPLEKIIQRRLAIMSEELPFDPQRIKAWTFCMTVLSIAWTYEDYNKIPAHETAVAHALYLLL